MKMKKRVWVRCFVRISSLCQLSLFEIQDLSLVFWKLYHFPSLFYSLSLAKRALPSVLTWRQEHSLKRGDFMSPHWVLNSCILQPGSNDQVASFVVGPGELVCGVGVQGSDRSEPGFAQSCRLLIRSIENLGTNSPGLFLEVFLIVEVYGYDLAIIVAFN